MTRGPKRAGGRRRYAPPSPEPPRRSSTTETNASSRSGSQSGWPQGWIDYRELRERADFAAILSAYGVTLKLRGEQHHGFCPLPTHEGTGKSPSFSAHMGKKAFHCFGCEAKGNVIEFVARMESLDPEDPKQFRRAAILMRDRFLPELKGGNGNGEAKADRKAKKKNGDGNEDPSSDSSPSSSSSSPAPAAAAVVAPPPDPGDAREEAPEDNPDGEKLPVIVNAPLAFELKRLDPSHPYLKARGLTPETISYFGLGFCPSGIMQGRIAIPIHDADGKLVGYAGRIVDDKLIGPECPKYLLPGRRERDGAIYEFSKSRLLFNAHRLNPPVDDILAVEGFFSVFWMVQCGYPNVVALMGSSCSTVQADLLIQLTKPGGRVWVIPDGDAAGRRCAESVLTLVASERFVRWIKLAEGLEPEDFYQPTVCAARKEPARLRTST